MIGIHTKAILHICVSWRVKHTSHSSLSIQVNLHVCSPSMWLVYIKKFCVIGIALHLYKNLGRTDIFMVSWLSNCNLIYLCVYLGLLCPSVKLYNFMCKILSHHLLGLCQGAPWFLWSLWMELFNRFLIDVAGIQEWDWFCCLLMDSFFKLKKCFILEGGN